MSFFRFSPCTACAFFLVGCTSFTVEDPSVSEGPDIVINQPMHQLVSACVTREQAESVLKVRLEKGPEETSKLFNEHHCFTAHMNLLPIELVVSRRVDGKVVSIVEIIVQTGLASYHVIYMITPNRVVVGDQGLRLPSALLRTRFLARYMDHRIPYRAPSESCEAIVSFRGSIK